MKRILFIVIFFIPIFLNAQKINELMTNNVSATLDDDYNYSMWVEIYNNTASAINQSAYYFTDNLKIPQKWTPVSKTIASGGFGILYFEREERTGHASFKLDPDGGKLYLVNSALQAIDSVRYPAQYRNISYGRKTDGANEWVFFEQFSKGLSNNGKAWSFTRCGKPAFTVQGGFFPSSTNTKFVTPAAGDTIYYTTNGSEPSKTNGIRYTPGYSVSLTSTTTVRARCVGAGKLSGDIATSTFFIGERDFNLPVVSIVTTQANLTDNTIGMYCDGTNGITGNGQTSPRNYNQDWDRPVNFELFDTTGVARLNQEVDIKIVGAWTRANAQKSLAIMPRKKHGDSELRYDVFHATKPNHKYKDIQIRNSGNDFSYSMMRDGFMQSVVMKRFDLDYLAYEPAVCFMNGVYYGIQNLRERTSEDFMFSNYGYNDDEVTIIEATNQGIDTKNDIATDAGYAEFTSFLKNNDITTPSVYDQVNKLMDIDEFINYQISETFFGNYDWPYNNVKLWKLNTENRWRWILFDTDFGFGLYNTTLYNFNTLTFALGENQENIIGGYSVQPEWSTIVLSRLVQNQTFLNKFIDRYAIHLSSTFTTTRMNAIMDSVAKKITNEIVYHKAKFGSSRTFANDLTVMKNFSAYRADKMLGFISARFLNSAAIQTVQISSNLPNASYTLNGEQIIDPSISLKYFSNRSMTLKANNVPAYKFKQWEISGGTVSNTLIPMGSSWLYSDGSTIPTTNWYSKTYNDASWKTGNAQLGYGGKGEVTTIGYGGNANSKYTTAYFRKTFSITNLTAKSNFVLTAFVDDGAVIYINGTELSRANMPTGTIDFSTFATTYSSNGTTYTFSVPASMLTEGNNVIAVEVHQNAANSSDLVFNLSLTCDAASTQIITTPEYSTTLTTGFSIKAIYEQYVFEDPDKNIDVKINELVASNNIIQDEFGETDDFIEIYNNGDKEVNVAGWYMSDIAGTPDIFRISTADSSKTVIPAKGRITFWADNQPEQGALHLGVKFSKEGEKIYLSKANYLGTIVLVDSVTFPYLEQNMSFSRVPDGSSNLVVQAPTFNWTNGDVSGFERQEAAIRVFPTLVTEYFRVTNASGQSVKIYDMTGRLKLSEECTTDNLTIQTANFTAGMYFVTIGDQKFKFIKR